MYNIHSLRIQIVDNLLLWKKQQTIQSARFIATYFLRDNALCVFSCFYLCWALRLNSRQVQEARDSISLLRFRDFSLPGSICLHLKDGTDPGIFCSSFLTVWSSAQYAKGPFWVRSVLSLPLSCIVYSCWQLSPPSVIMFCVLEITQD